MAAMERARSSLREQVSKKNEKLSRKQEELPTGKLKASDLHVGDKVKNFPQGSLKPPTFMLATRYA